jgi:hypothetical protein
MQVTDQPLGLRERKNIKTHRALEFLDAGMPLS